MAFFENEKNGVFQSLYQVKKEDILTDYDL